jgi:DNA-binding CsgD family transcriptional regulator
MNAHERILSLIRDVYTAAADEALWPAVLVRLSDEFGGGVAGLQYRAGPEGRVTSGRFVRLDPVLQEALRTYYADCNPWVKATQSLLLPGVVIPTHHVVPLSELRRTEFHDGVLRHAQVLHGFGACVLRRDDRLVSFTVVRSDVNGPYEAQEVARVRAILPHLHRAMQVNARFAELRRTHTALADSLERLHHGVVIVNRSGRVIFANRAARSVVAQRDGLAITADGLTAAAPHQRLALRSLVDDAVRTSRGEGAGAGGAMSISRRSLKRPYAVLVAPLPLAPDAEGPSGLASVFISDPEVVTGTTETVARRLYGLSAAEARLAQALVTTASLERAAEQLCIARETARWHLKRIYRKTGTHHQAALVRRLVNGPSKVALDLEPARETSGATTT